MFNFILYKIGQFLALNLPLSASYRLACFFANLKCFFSPRDRRLVINNLRFVTGAADNKILKRYAYQMYINFAKYLVDFFRFSLINDDYIKKYVKIENLDYVDRVLKEGKGIVALTAHLGNWELGGVVLAKLGYPLNAIVLAHQEKLVNDFFIRQRSFGNNVKLIPLGASIKRAFVCLKHSEILAIVADRDFLKSGFKVNLFSKPSIMPKGPALLALKCGAPIIPGFMIRQSDDTFRLIFEPAINFSPTQNTQTDLLLLTQACSKVLEKYIRLYPTQWFMFRKFWED